MAFTNGFLVWFFGHLAFIVLGALLYGWLIIYIEVIAFFISLPALVLYTLAAWALQKTKLTGRMKSVLYEVFCLGVTLFLILKTTASSGVSGDDVFGEGNRQMMWLFAVGSTAVGLLLRRLAWGKKWKDTSLDPPSSGSDKQRP